MPNENRPCSIRQVFKWRNVSSCMDATRRSTLSRSPRGHDREKPKLNWLNVLGIAVGLSMDAFAVSIAAGLQLAPVSSRQVFRLAFHFGLFQWMMPIAGWLLGWQMASWLHGFDHWIAFGLLSLIGAKMLRETGGDTESRTPSDPTRGWTLVLLSVATSIDALAVGLSIAFLGVSVWIPAVVIGVTTGTLSAIGITFAGRIGQRWRSWAGVVGGCTLILIGLRILGSHLTA